MTGRGWLRQLLRGKRWYWRLARIVLGVVIIGSLLIVIFENSLIFHPMRHPAGEWEFADTRPAPGRLGPAVEDVWFEASDGVRLHGWFCRPVRNVDGQLEDVPTTRTMLWCHGNAGNITHRSGRINRFIAFPANVFVFDYRGFGRSAGRPREAGIYRDAEAAWDYLVETRGIPAERIVIYGVSLGAAAATHLARRQKDAAGLIVESAFTSIPDMGAATMPWVPRFLIRTRMDNRARIPGIAMPKLFIHGDADEIIPYQMGQKLHELASPPKHFYTVRGGTHNETLWIGGEEYIEVIGDFLDEVAPESP